MVLHSIGRSQKAWYGLDYRVFDRDGTLLVDLPETDWADWDGGDLVFARGGCLYRLAKATSDPVMSCLLSLPRACMTSTAQVSPPWHLRTPLVTTDAPSLGEL